MAHQAPHSSVGAGSAWHVVLIAFVGIIAIDIFRVGFFADDFHFLDVARRLSWLSALSGQYGIWPWYRPLSRELYFELIVGAGGSVVVAHCLSVACLVVCGLLLKRIGTRLLNARAGMVGALLFVSYSYAKFLAAWASGFQDLLALALTLGAIDAAQMRRPSRALVLSALAPFAKETGFLVFPLLALMHGFSRDRSRAWLQRIGLVAIGCLTVHVLVRLHWRPVAPGEPARAAGTHLLVVAYEVARGFLPFTIDWAGTGVAQAAAVALITAILVPRMLRTAAPGPDDRPGASGHGGARIVVAAACLGMFPLVAGHVLKLTLPHAYHAFPAIPWIALILGSVLAKRGAVASILLPAVLALNAWSLPFTVPDLDRPEDWNFKGWDWREAVRLTAVSRRLTRDVRLVLAERPDSCVVLYEGLPQGCFFQTEDGPATREALSDLTARAYWINDPGPIADPGRLAIVSFDSERHHLVKTVWSSRTALQRAINAVIAGRPHAAVVFASYREAEDPAAFDRHYVRAAAMLLAHGPLAYANALEVDTAGTAPDLIARPLVEASSPLGIALAAVLRRPLTAATHLALADTLLRRGVLPRAGLELRIALALAPGRSEARLQLARVMIDLGGDLEAMAELKRVTAAADPSTRAEAQRLLAEVERRAAASASFDIPRGP